jgi:hypothetical protein
MCMLKSTGKRGQKVVEEENADDADDNTSSG